MITYGDYTINSGHYDITPEQGRERLVETLTAALEPFAKSKRGLEITIQNLDDARTALAQARKG